LLKYTFSKLNGYTSMTIYDMNYFTVNEINNKPSVRSNFNTWLIV